MQQCNCWTVKSHGLSAQIVKRFPWANVYERREPRSANCALVPAEPGTFLLTGNIIHLFSQVYPGKPGVYDRFYPKCPWGDTARDRVHYFQKCIDSLDVSLSVIAVPYGIGCGLAGGRWSVYREILEKSKLSFVIYKLED